MLVDKINAYLVSTGKKPDAAILDMVAYQSGHAFKRQFMEDRNAPQPGTIRMSSCGKCPRQVAYAFHGIPENGCETTARTLFVWWYGDVIEVGLVGLAQAAGCGLTHTGSDQKTVYWTVDGFTLTGHPDGYLPNNEGLAEFKSMTTYAFSDLEKGIIDDGYVAQASIYLEAENLPLTRIVGACKNAGVLAEQVINKKTEVVNKVREDIRQVINSAPDRLPKRRYEPKTIKAGTFWPWQCLYCSYWKTCLAGQAEKVVVSKAYKLKWLNKGQK